MAEQTSTVIDTSDLVGGEIINKTILDSQETDKTNQTSIIDTSDLVGGETIDNTLTTDTTSITDTSDLVGGENPITGEEWTEPSTWDKLEYGWDKETW